MANTILGLAYDFRRKISQDYELSKEISTSVGWIGAIGHPIYWFIWVYIFPQPYESTYFRFSCALLFAALPLCKHAPKALERWVPIYWFTSITLGLPTIFTFLMLMSDFSKIYITCGVMVIFVLPLFLRGITSVLASLTIGTVSGLLIYLISSPPGHSLSNYQEFLEFSPLLGFALLTGSIFTHGFKEGVRAEELRIAAEEREKSLKALAGSIAHEMRNPLGQIRFSLHSMRNLLPRPIAHVEPDTAPPTVSPADLNAIYRHLAQGETSINRGLQIIGMTLNEVSGKPIDRASFEYLSASKATSKAVEEYSFDSPGERDKVTLEVRKDFTIKVNETAYIFILFNLIKNALYYFKQYPQATLLITVNAPCVTVRDTGPGIAPEMLNKLFGSFVSAGKAGGTGLGLAYCQRTMQAFGGDIVCNSVLGSYTEFTLLFPPISEAEIQLEEHKVMSQAVPFFDGKRVLVVDDQPFVRQSTCRALEGIATRVDEAEDGAQAITKLRLGIYDLVVMDLDMPVLDGYAAAEQIRQGAAPGHEEVAIVAYTAESAYVAQVKTEKVGMNGFVSKPCSQTELLRTLQAGMQAAAEATRLKGAARRLVGKRVLVADDCAFNRKITVAYLRTMGIQSVEAQNGQEALDLACMDERFDAALLDMEMPVMNGVQTARALRSAETGGRRLPLIALTAHLCDTHMTQALEAGMDGFVSKPFSDAHLRTTLLKVLPPERAASGANGPSKS